jgi:hypothetical protein
MKTTSNDQAFYELNKMMPLSGYFILEYTPDDGRGMIAHVDKIPLVGIANALIENKFGWFPVTLRGIYLHDEENPPTILCPCGGVLTKDVFLDSLDDFMQAMAYRHSMYKKV